MLTHLTKYRKESKETKSLVATIICIQAFAELIVKIQKKVYNLQRPKLNKKFSLAKLTFV